MRTRWRGQTVSQQPEPDDGGDDDHHTIAGATGVEGMAQTLQPEGGRFGARTMVSSMPSCVAVASRQNPARRRKDADDEALMPATTLAAPATRTHG